MIVKLVSEYLATHKRLVVPNLGTFIVKVPNESILFSNLIKTDDGVLRSLLVQNGVSELEAAGMVDRFVFEIQYRLQTNGSCRMGRFGELRSGANGTVTFAYAPTAGDDAPNPNAEASPAEPDRTVETASADDTAPEHSGESRQAQATAADDTPRRPSNTETAAEQTVARPSGQAGPETGRAVSSEKAKALYGEQPRTISPQMQPADYVKGLRYGKGRRVPAGREYGAPRANRKSDIIMIVAITAALLAIMALGYGTYCEWKNSRMDTEIYGEPQPSAEGTVRNPDLDYIEPYDK